MTALAISETVVTMPPFDIDASEMEETANLLVDGELAKQMGVSSAQLALGLNVARNHIARGAYGDALRIYASLVLCEPKNPSFQLGLANCASLMGEHYLAIQAASAVVALSPSDPKGYFISGRSCLAIGDLVEAREDLRDAAKLAQASGENAVEADAKRLLDHLNTLPS